MSDDRAIYLHLAALLSYPEPDYVEHVSHLRAAAKLDPEVLLSLDVLFAFLTDSKSSSVEELFTQTFDMNPDTCLEVGWHLFGEDYKRGEFLVSMRDALREYTLVESVELPDHISHCLQLLAKLEGKNAQGLARDYLLPSVEKMLGSFKQENPFRVLLEILCDQLETHYGKAEPQVPRLGNSARDWVQIST